MGLQRSSQWGQGPRGSLGESVSSLRSQRAPQKSDGRETPNATASRRYEVFRLPIKGAVARRRQTKWAVISSEFKRSPPKSDGPYTQQVFSASSIKARAGRRQKKNGRFALWGLSVPSQERGPRSPKIDGQLALGPFTVSLPIKARADRRRLK